MASATNEQLFAVGQVLVSGRIGLGKIDREKLQRLINNPDELARRATFWLENDCQTQFVIKAFSVWREVTVGPKTAEQFAVELAQTGNEVGGNAKMMMGRPEFQTVKEPVTLKLDRVKVRDFGFTEEPTTDELWARIQELGGQLCPPEVGPQLRKDCNDQTNDDAFWLAMKQLADSDGSLSVFCVRRLDCGGRWLCGRYAGPGRRWNLDSEIVFVLGE